MLRKNSTAVVIVTYNRLELLKSCITAVKNQTLKPATILIINNSSTDGTTEWLTEQKDITYITQPNDGGAAGFYTGIKTAFESGNEWIWCMDDDGRPAINALELLINHSNRNPCVINCLVVSDNNDDDIVFKTGKYTRRSEIKEEIIEGVANFFNGTLFHYDVISKVGLPIKELIIWGDEAEYFNRIKYRYAFPLFTVANSLHYHPKQSGAFYKKEWLIEKDWKPFFYIRNKIYYYQSKYSSKARSTASYFIFLSLFAATIIFYQKTSKLKKLNLLWQAGKAGFGKDLVYTISDVKNKFCN